MKRRSLAGWYDFFNSRYFAGRLPHPLVITYKTPARGKRNLGESAVLLVKGCPPLVSYIRINPRLKGMDTVILSTLLHEMVHISLEAAGEKGSCKPQGKAFTRELRRLMRAGAYDRLL